MAYIVAICIGITAVAIAIGPFLSMPSYSSVRHTTSELAGQRMPNAWVMRTGLFSYGLCSLLLALRRPETGVVGTVALALFGLGLIGSAVWSHKPIDPEMPFSISEDRVHSFFASMIGFAFATAVVAKLLVGNRLTSDWLSWTALAASIVLPVGMAVTSRFAGLFQRAIFGISFVWILREALSS